MDLSTNQNNCMVHPLNYNMLQLHSQYAHTLHILKTFVVAREQFIFNTASYIIHSDCVTLDQTVRLVFIVHSVPMKRNCLNSTDAIITLDGLNPDDWWRWGRRPPSSHSWAEPGAARCWGHSLQPLSGSSGWTDDRSDTYHPIFEWAPEQLSPEWVKAP